MYKHSRRRITDTSILVNKSKEGEPIEAKIRRVVNNKEPIKDAAPQVFTERKEGVKPEFDIRADKWDAAVEVTTAISNSHSNKREERIAERTWDTMSDADKQAFKTKYPHNPLSKTETGGQSTPQA